MTLLPRRLSFVWVLVPVFAWACTSVEAPRVERAVVVDSSGIEPVVTDLGWTVTVTEARVAVHDFEFTTAGELHDDRVGPSSGPGSGALDLLFGLLLPIAHAHPGHSQSGEILGELSGEFVLDLLADGDPIGTATLIVGDYTAVNFDLGRADELEPDDPLAGHTAWLVATAVADPVEIELRVALDSPIDRQLVGAPFEVTIDAEAEIELGFRLLPLDPLELDTLFDGLDFAALDLADGDPDGQLVLRDPELDPDQPVELTAAYNDLRQRFQTHDHYDVVARTP